MQILLIESSDLCPKLKFDNTTSRLGKQFKLKPDISIYSGSDRDNLLAGSERPPGLDWRAVDLWIENKNEGDDVFRDLEQMKKEEKQNQDLTSQIEWTNTAYRISGQLIGYASALHRYQFRVFSFSVVLFGESGRLLR